jgi:hypothetical protein
MIPHDRTTAVAAAVIANDHATAAATTVVVADHGCAATTAVIANDYSAAAAAMGSCYCDSGRKQTTREDQWDASHG